MTHKKNIALLGLLALQIVLIAYGYWPTRESQEPTAHFLANFNLAQVKKLVITDEEKKSVTLAQEEGKWVVGEERFPANQATIQALVEKLGKLESNRLITASKSSYRRLKVAEDTFVRRLEIELADGASKTLFLGSSPSQKTIHVRLADAQGVYLVNDFSSWEVQAGSDSWWRSKFVDLAALELQALTLVNSEGTIALGRAKEGWHLAGSSEKLASTAVEGLLANIGRLTFSRYLPVESKLPAQKNIASLQLDTATGPLSLLVWAKETGASGGEHPVKASDTSFSATMREGLLSELLAMKQQDLLAPPPGEETAPASPEEQK